MPDATHNTACIGCGYLLRSLSDDDACPECGLAVAASIRRLVIATDDEPAWRQVHQGMRLLPWVVLPPAAGAAAAVALLWAIHTPRGGTTPALAVAGVGLLAEALLVWPATRCLTAHRLTGRRLPELRPGADARHAATALIAFDAAALVAAAWAVTTGVVPHNNHWLYASAAVILWLPTLIIRLAWARGLAGHLAELARGLSPEALQSQGNEPAVSTGPAWRVPTALRGVASAQAGIAGVTLLAVLCLCLLPIFASPYVMSAAIALWLSAAAWATHATTVAARTLRRHVAIVAVDAEADRSAQA